MRPGLASFLAALLASLYVALNVWGNHGGEITGLFHTGSEVPLPADVASHTRRVPGPGYDGQFYHVAAHDPLLRRGYERYVDNARLRWRRIGLPAAAALFGPARDTAYVALEVAFAGLGSWWLAMYAASLGMSPAWGLCFFAIPATAVSLDRMTVDLPLAALVVGVLLYARAWLVFPILVAAAVVRETGVVVLAGWCAWSLLEGRRREALLGALCALPAAAWWAFVHANTPPDGTAWLGAYPFSGLLERTLKGSGTPSGGLWLTVASITEETANAGIWLAVLLALYVAARGKRALPEVIAVVFTLFAATLGREDLWTSAYATGRTLSPLLLVLGAVALRDRRPLFACPLLMVLPRIALQYEAEIVGALRTLL